MEYYQEKIQKTKELKSTCNLSMFIDDNVIKYAGVFYSEYSRLSVINGTRFLHEITIDKHTGDFTTSYKIENNKDKESKFLRSGVWKSWVKKNNFNKLLNLTELGFYAGERRLGYWGVKYNKALNDFFEAIKTDLSNQIHDTYLNKKVYNEPVINKLYDLVVDFHLHKKNIKGHDNVYSDIMLLYPKKKWLKLNENKFLPSILDEHGLKSKFTIGELSCTSRESSINVKTFVYICKLFGENYIDYIKKIDWFYLSKIQFSRVKTHTAKNENEKQYLVDVFNSWEHNEYHINHPLNLIYDVFEIREFLAHRGYTDLKLKAKTIDGLESLYGKWQLMKKHFNTGYKLRYTIPEDIVNEIEQPIEIDDKIYVPKLLLSEDDFTMEGYKMKNCMSRQFMHGSIHMFIALSLKNKRINVQYQKGVHFQSFAKANTPVPLELFGPGIYELNKRMSKYNTLSWEKEKYDFLKH